MKKFSLLIALFISVSLSAQMGYWTAYQMDIPGENQKAVVDLFDAHFAANPTPDGVSAYLWENHFRSSENNYSHMFVWTGSAEALGKMYSTYDKDWDLVISKVSRLTDDLHAAQQGNTMLAVNADSDTRMFQRYYNLSANNAAAMEKAIEKVWSKNAYENRTYYMGKYKLGMGKEDATHWIWIGSNSIADVFMSDDDRADDAAYQKNFKTFYETSGGATMVSSGMLLLRGSW